MNRFITRAIANNFRRYATEAPAAAPAGNKILLTLATPSQTLFKNASIDKVLLRATTGDMTISPKESPGIYQLQPSLIKIIGTETKSFFVSAGYAVVNADGSLHISVFDAVPPAKLDKAAIESNLNESENSLKNAKTEFEKGVHEVEISVAKALLKAVEEK